MAELTKMVAPDGTVIDVHPDEMPLAQAHSFVRYGSPEHMAQMGVKGPDIAAGSMPANPINADDYAASKARQIVVGAGIKGPMRTISGLASLVPGLNRTDAVKQAQEYAQPASPYEAGGQTAEQIAEFALPVAAAAKVGKAIPVAQRIVQGRNAAGQFLAATRSPVTRDLLARAAAKVATQAGATGLLTEAQGGDFSTGAALGAGGGALGEGLAAAEPAIAGAAHSAAQNPIVQRILGLGGAGAALGVLTGHISGRRLAEGTAAALALTPTGRLVLRGALKTVPGAVNSNAARNLADAEAHKNIGD